MLTRQTSYLEKFIYFNTDRHQLTFYRKKKNLCQKVEEERKKRKNQKKI